MKIQIVSKSNMSFGLAKTVTAYDVLKKIVEPIKKASPREKKTLYKALGLSSVNSTNSHLSFESFGNDIICGEITLPNISVTARGISPIQAVGNVINIELARIRGQLKQVKIEDLKL